MKKTKAGSYLFIVILAIALGIGGFLLLSDTAPPALTISHEGTIAPTRTVTVTAMDSRSAIKRITIQAVVNEKVTTLVDQQYTSPDLIQSTLFTIKDTEIKQGPIDIIITAYDSSLAWFGRGNKNTLTAKYIVDAVPPRVYQKTSQPYIRRGGAGVILYSASKELEKTGVHVGEFFFPAYKQASGDYLCFFAFPHFMTTAEFNPQIYAEDKAGNTLANSLKVYKLHREFKHDTLPISEGFLNSKATEFEAMVPGNMSDISRFLKVNGPVRKASTEQLFKITATPSPTILWEGNFLRLPRSANRAGFADHRTYTWNGDAVDEQTHLGLDLASVARDSVPATNDGIVAFTGYLGIYGNLVIIDHGAGVHSLYSHLSEITIENNIPVKRGDIVGKTGSTGMAGGDHLHYGVLIGGLEVTPIEWLDGKWIKDNITDRLKDAGFPQ